MTLYDGRIVRAFATRSAGLTNHTRLEYGKILTIVWKEFIQSDCSCDLRLAVARSQSGEVLSTKGVL